MKSHRSTAHLPAVKKTHKATNRLDAYSAKALPKISMAVMEKLQRLRTIGAKALSPADHSIIITDEWMGATENPKWVKKPELAASLGHFPSFVPINDGASPNLAFVANLDDGDSFDESSPPYTGIYSDTAGTELYGELGPLRPPFTGKGAGIYTRTTTRGTTRGTMASREMTANAVVRGTTAALRASGSTPLMKPVHESQYNHDILKVLYESATMEESTLLPPSENKVPPIQLGGRSMCRPADAGTTHSQDGIHGGSDAEAVEYTMPKVTSIKSLHALMLEKATTAGGRGSNSSNISATKSASTPNLVPVTPGSAVTVPSTATTKHKILQHKGAHRQQKERQQQQQQQQQQQDENGRLSDEIINKLLLKQLDPSSSAQTHTSYKALATTSSSGTRTAQSLHSRAGRRAETQVSAENWGFAVGSGPSVTFRPRDIAGDKAGGTPGSGGGSSGAGGEARQMQRSLKRRSKSSSKLQLMKHIDKRSSPPKKSSLRTSSSTGMLGSAAAAAAASSANNADNSNNIDTMAPSPAALYHDQNALVGGGVRANKSSSTSSLGQTATGLRFPGINVGSHHVDLDADASANTYIFDDTIEEEDNLLLSPRLNETLAAWLKHESEGWEKAWHAVVLEQHEMEDEVSDLILYEDKRFLEQWDREGAEFRDQKRVEEAEKAELIQGQRNIYIQQGKTLDMAKQAEREMVDTLNDKDKHDLHALVQSVCKLRQHRIGDRPKVIKKAPVIRPRPLGSPKHSSFSPTKKNLTPDEQAAADAVADIEEEQGSAIPADFVMDIYKMNYATIVEAFMVELARTVPKEEKQRGLKKSKIEHGATVISAPSTDSSTTRRLRMSIDVPNDDDEDSGVEDADHDSADEDAGHALTRAT